MRSYSPYDNVKAQPYPTMLVRTSYDDSQVMYWEPAKWVARRWAEKTDTTLALQAKAGAGRTRGRLLRDQRSTRRSFSPSPRTPRVFEPRTR